MSARFFTCRHARSHQRWVVFTAIAMLMAGVPRAGLVPTVEAQVAPVGSGFTTDAGDLRFIPQQILVAQDHAVGGTLPGPRPNQVADPQLAPDPDSGPLFIANITPKRIQKDSGRTLARIRAQRGPRARSYGAPPADAAAYPQGPGTRPR